MPVYYDPKSSIPLPPANAQKLKTVCHYCIVGCSYDVYKWPVTSPNGGTAPSQNALGVDFSKRQDALTGTWISPEQHTVIKERDGTRYNVVIIPNKKAQVNSGLSSVRGGTLAASLFAPDKPTTERLHYPLVYRARDLNITSWDNAVELVAKVVKQSIDKAGPNSIFMKFFDHGGGGGGFELNWSVGKFFFTGVKTIMASIHNRPAYNSEVHASRDMGVPELNNSYEDAELADTIVLWGANSYETQTNYYLNHMVPNLRGATLDKKKKVLGETVAKAKMIVADPRVTTTVSTARFAAGKDNVLHLQLKPGTDIALLNAIGRVVLDKSWQDQGFIDQRTESIDQYKQVGLQVGRSLDDVLAEAEQITGVARADIQKAASWIAQPKSDHKRTRTLLHYEKGMIWGLKNYDNIGSIVSLALLTGNLGKPGTGVSRLGGHQEGYVRPDYAGPRPAIYIDPLLASGQGRVFWVGGCTPYITTLNAERIRNVLEDRGAIVRKALDSVHSGNIDDQVRAIGDALDQGGLFVVTQDIYLSKTAEHAHVVLPAAAWGESPITSINGERRLRLYEQIQDPPGEAKPDWAIMGLVAQRLQTLYQADGNSTLAAQFSGFGWKSAEEVFLEGGKSFPSPTDPATNQPRPVPIETYSGMNYDQLRKLGHDGIQTPIKTVNNKLQGTIRLFENGDPFRTKSGKAHFMGFNWPGYPPEVKAQMDKYPFFFTNGRINVAWQTMYNDTRMPFQDERVPMAWLEIHADDASKLQVESGDLLEVFNDYGSANAVAYITPAVKAGIVFMQFAHPRGTANSVTTPYVDPMTTIPYYKGSAVGLRKLGSLPAIKNHLSWIPVINTV